MPLWILLIPFALFLVVFIVFGLIDIYHAFQFRSGIISAILLIVFFLAGTAGIFYLSALLLLPVDWTGTIGTAPPALPDFGL